MEMVYKDFVEFLSDLDIASKLLTFPLFYILITQLALNGQLS